MTDWTKERDALARASVANWEHRYAHTVAPDPLRFMVPSTILRDLSGALDEIARLRDVIDAAGDDLGGHIVIPAIGDRNAVEGKAAWIARWEAKAKERT